MSPEPSSEWSSSTGTWIAGGLVPLPNLTLNDPPSLVLTDTGALDEGRRFCPNPECRAEVGRSRDGEAGLVDGFCEQCGARYSFSLKLSDGDEVDNRRYLVKGPLNHGGFGWVYLAWDTRLEQWVVLKGLINTADRRAQELATNERIALTALDHQNLVRIQDFVHHPDPGSGEPIDYIVMEYVGGPALSELKPGMPWHEEHGPMTSDRVIAYVLEILSALAYLHNTGLLYCDMKPANAIRGVDRLKVIDLGGVRAIDDVDSAAVGTKGYRVSEDELDQHGHTVRSDLHTVGKTLQVLYDDADDVRRDRLRPGPVSFGLRSLRHVYERAMDDYHRRFGSAAEMSVQLKGVLREIVALRGGRREPEPSTVFGEPTALLDAGLGAVPPLSRWTDAPPDPHALQGDGRPSPRAVARGLLVPLVGPDQVGGVTDASAVIELLKRPSTPRTVELHLRVCRAMIELGDLDGAADQVSTASGLLGCPESADWRFAWHRGLIDLARDDVAEATPRFAEVYRDVPGEDLPKLALGFCAEHRGDRSGAETFYEAVWARERLQASAAFGLARARLASRGRAAAVEVLDQLGEHSRHVEAARIAAIMVLAGRFEPGPNGGPTAADLTEAAARLTALTSLDGGERDGPLRARLVAVLREAALGLSGNGVPAGVRGGDVLGDGPSARTLRRLVEDSFRGLAEQAHDAREHAVLVDRANTERPYTWW